MRIDAHQHFWNYDPVRDSWITEDMQVIRRDFCPQDLKPILDQHQLDGCVAVQADQSEAENDFLLQQAQGNTFIKGIVGWVDLQGADIRERLSYFKQFPLIKGFRHILQGEKDRALMLRPPFQRGIAALKEFGFTYDILIYPDQLPFSAQLVAAFPEQLFVLDHMAKPYIRKKDMEGWKKDVSRLAQYPNVCCKVSGMVTEADWRGWQPEDFAPYLDVVVDAFGTERLLFGSDWPVCLVAASYSSALQIVQDYFSPFSAAEQAQIFGENAVRFYNLR